MNLLNKLKFKAKGFTDTTPKRGNRTFDQMAESEDYCVLTSDQIKAHQQYLKKTRLANREKRSNLESEKEVRYRPKYKEDWKASLHGESE